MDLNDNQATLLNQTIGISCSVGKRASAARSFLARVSHPHACCSERTSRLIDSEFAKLTFAQKAHPNRANLHILLIWSEGRQVSYSRVGSNRLYVGVC